MNWKRADVVRELLWGTCGNSTGDIAAREGLCKTHTGLSWTPQTQAGKGGSPKSKQDTDLALQRESATHQAGDVEAEGSLPLDLLQQSTEGVLGEAEPWWAASGQLQAGSEWQSLCGGHHARPGILREELQGTEQGGTLVGLRRLHWAAFLPVDLMERLTRGLSALK